MRGKIRGRKKVKINYKRLTCTVIILLLIAILSFLGIRYLSRNNTNVAENNNENKEEVIVPEDITINLVATRRYNVS